MCKVNKGKVINKNEKRRGQERLSAGNRLWYSAAFVVLLN